MPSQQRILAALCLIAPFAALVVVQLATGNALRGRGRSIRRDDQPALFRSAIRFQIIFLVVVLLLLIFG
ncbi:MAG TPA: hypothetical protein VGI81_03015 [Tepidisphaeraceae bacterium]|jgi:hypothetical protein